MAGVIVRLESQNFGNASIEEKGWLHEFGPGGWCHRWECVLLRNSPMNENATTLLQGGLNECIAGRKVLQNILIIDVVDRDNVMFKILYEVRIYLLP